MAPASTSSSSEVEELREEVRELRAEVRQTNRRLDRVVSLLEGAIDSGVPMIVGRDAGGAIVRLREESSRAGADRPTIMNSEGARYQEMRPQQFQAL